MKKAKKSESMKCESATMSQPKSWLTEWRAFAKKNKLSFSELIATAVNEYVQKKTGKTLTGNRPKRGGQVKES